MSELWELLAKRISELPIIRRKLKEPLTGSDVFMILNVWKELQKEVK